ncbi:MAG: major capsid protein P2 [Minwuiales bacterium]|nr:major capsid protein P2 [Minwuiales bacterium]
MAAPRPITTNSFNAVGANQRATLELPVGRLTYHQIEILYGTGAAGGPTRGNMESQINDIRVKIGGKTQREHSAAELFLMNESRGIEVQDGFLPIFFAEPWRRSVNGEEALAWGTADIPDLIIEVDLDSTANAPTLEARIIVTDDPRKLDLIKKVKRSTVDVTATGTKNVTSLPRTDAYYALHAISTDIEAVKVIVDQEDQWELPDSVARELYDQNGLTVPAGLTSVIWDYRNRVGDTLDMSKRVNGQVVPVTEFRVDYEMTAATPFTLLQETLGFRD